MHVAVPERVILVDTTTREFSPPIPCPLHYVFVYTVRDSGHVIAIDSTDDDPVMVMHSFLVPRRIAVGHPNRVITADELQPTFTNWCNAKFKLCQKPSVHATITARFIPEQVRKNRREVKAEEEETKEVVYETENDDEDENDAVSEMEDDEYDDKDFIDKDFIND